MTTEYSASKNTTVVVAKRRTGRGWESFTIYSDAEDTFVSYHEIHATREEAETRATKLVKKFSK